MISPASVNSRRYNTELSLDDKITRSNIVKKRKYDIVPIKKKIKRKKNVLLPNIHKN